MSRNKTVLTDKQIMDICHDVRTKAAENEDPVTAMDIARAIEAAVLASADNPSTAGALQNIDRLTRFWWTHHGMEAVDGQEYTGSGFYAAGDVERVLAAPVAQSTAGTATIDTPEFRKLLNVVARGKHDHWTDMLIAHINARLATPALNPSEAANVEDARDAARLDWLGCGNLVSLNQYISNYAANRNYIETPRFYFCIEIEYPGCEASKFIEGESVRDAIDAAMSATQEGK